MIKKPDFLLDALLELCPGAKFAIVGPENNIEWRDESIPRPTDAEIAAKVTELDTKWENLLYQRYRAMEYPPITDYIDGVVKGDQAQIDAYIAACREVKNKYPKQ